jgi:hypothetical protein
MMRRKFKNLLFSLSDRICSCSGAGSVEGVRHPWLFKAGHLVGELGWKLRRAGG